MAKGSWATYLHHKKKWNLYSAGETGQKLDVDNHLQAKIDRMPIISKVITGDDVLTNNCVLGT